MFTLALRCGAYCGCCNVGALAQPAVAGRQAGSCTRPNRAKELWAGPPCTPLTPALTSFHTPNPLSMQTGESEALRKVKILGWASLGSFVFDFWKWFFQGTDYGG